MREGEKSKVKSSGAREAKGTGVSEGNERSTNKSPNKDFRVEVGMREELGYESWEGHVKGNKDDETAKAATLGLGGIMSEVTCFK